MRPYYERGSIRLYLGTAQALLPEVRGDAVIVTDPPYNVGMDYDGMGDSQPDDAYRAVLEACTTPPAVVLHYPERLFQLAQRHGVPEKVVAWVYHANTPRQWRMLAWFGITPDFTKLGQPYRNPDDVRVAALIAQGRQARLYDWWLDEQVKNVGGEKTAHPCQIPIGVMRRAVAITPAPDGICDPFAGSGTTLVAARQAGVAAVGIEQSERYCELAARRLAQEL